MKESSERGSSIRELALEKAKAGKLFHKDELRPITSEEVEGALEDLRRLTEDGIAG